MYLFSLYLVFWEMKLWESGPDMLRKQMSPVPVYLIQESALWQEMTLAWLSYMIFHAQKNL